MEVRQGEFFGRIIFSDAEKATLAHWLKVPVHSAVWSDYRDACEAMIASETHHPRNGHPIEPLSHEFGSPRTILP